MGVINTILGLGASVIMPIVIFLLGVVFRMKVKNALRAGLTVGIGFTGISLAISLVSDNLGGLVKAMQANWGFGHCFRKRNLCAGIHRDIPYSQCDLPGN